MPPKQAQKRKDPPKQSSSRGASGRDPKRAKILDARALASQSSDKALNANGELDVAAFVKSREFEIQALEDGIKSSKHGLSTRAFQQVPRDMRRRAASHNVKQIPKRLRARAAKEIKEDKTPTGSARKKDLTSKQRVQRSVAERAKRLGAKAKTQREALSKAQEAKAKPGDPTSDGILPSASVVVNPGSQAPASIQPFHPPQTRKDVLVKAPKPVSKFRNRQKDKTWLPTHVFHAKRAHMTLPSEPLWRFAIPLSPSEKVYRTTHRAANMRGCVAWETSYVSTIMLEGAESSLIGLLRALGAPEHLLLDSKGAKWRQGIRSWSGWLRERDAPYRWIAEALVVWCAPDEELSEIASDPATEARTKRKMLLRVHPAGFLQVWNEVLKVGKMQRPALMVEDLRFDLGSIEVIGPGASEALCGVLHQVPVGEEVRMDPGVLARITSPAHLPEGALLNLVVSDPRLRHPPRTVDLSTVNEERVLELASAWPGDQAKRPGPLFDRLARFASCRLQSSQKAVNRRKGESDPGEFASPRSSDPQIPAMLCARNESRRADGSSSWTLIMPWNWILPFWNSIVYYPLSSGGSPRFGGLDEMRQMHFEQNRPWYPADFPGTQAGWNWELKNRRKREKEWQNRPKAKRTQWNKVDLGAEQKGEVGTGWACDWEKVLGLEISADKGETDANNDDSNGEGSDTTKESKTKKKDKKEDKKDTPLPDGVCQVFSNQLARQGFVPTERSLVTVRLTLISRGVPAICARIYRLPTRDEELKEQWRSTQDKKGNKGEKNNKDADALQSDAKSKHLRMPEPEDLIGFVTTGNFNLSEGQGTGIGCIALAKVWANKESNLGSLASGLCIVRNAGVSVGRLARWTAA